MIVLGLAGSLLAPKLAASYKQLTVRMFPDGELSVSLPQEITGTQVLVLFEWALLGTYDPVQGMLILLTLLQQLHTAGVTHVTLALTYLPFARSNYTPSSPLFLLGQQLKLFSFAQLITIDLHDEALMQKFPVPLINIPTTNLWAIGLLKYVQNIPVPSVLTNGLVVPNGQLEHGQTGPELCVISPDAGGAQRAERLAIKLGISWDAMHKVRVCHDAQAQAMLPAGHSIGEAHVSGLSCEVSGKTVVLLDDIVATAGTAVQACALVRQQGAVWVIGCFTHAVLAGDAAARLLQAGFDEIYVTTTVRSASPDPAIRLVALDSFLLEALWNLRTTFKQFGPSLALVTPAQSTPETATI